jgi:hypothetical protein
MPCPPEHPAAAGIPQTAREFTAPAGATIGGWVQRRPWLTSISQSHTFLMWAEPGPGPGVPTGPGLEQRKRTPARNQTGRPPPAGTRAHHVDFVSQITQVPFVLVFVLMVPSQIWDFIRIPSLRCARHVPGAILLNFRGRPTRTSTETTLFF